MFPVLSSVIASPTVRFRRLEASALSLQLYEARCSQLLLSRALLAPYYAPRRRLPPLLCSVRSNGSFPPGVSSSAGKVTPIQSKPDRSTPSSQATNAPFIQSAYSKSFSRPLCSPVRPPPSSPIAFASSTRSMRTSQIGCRYKGPQAFALCL